MSDTRVLALVGSLRSASINRRIAEAIRGQAPAGVSVEIAAADSVLVVTPEYNGSTPAVIANAIDWISRPYGSGAIKSKPVAVVGAEVLEHVEVSHPYAWGSDPSAEPETVGKFIDAVAQLVAHVPVSVG